MICEFTHHLVYLQHFAYAKKYTECHEVCSALLPTCCHFSQTSARCVQGRAEPRILLWFRCFVRAGRGLAQTCTSWPPCLLVSHPISPLHLMNISFSPMPSVPLTSHILPTTAIWITTSSVLQCP